MGLQFLKPTLKMKPNEDEVNLLWPSVKFDQEPIETNTNDDLSATQKCPKISILKNRKKENKPEKGRSWKRRFLKKSFSTATLLKHSVSKKTHVDSLDEISLGKSLDLVERRPLSSANLRKFSSPTIQGIPTVENVLIENEEKSSMTSCTTIDALLLSSREDDFSCLSLPSATCNPLITNYLLSSSYYNMPLSQSGESSSYYCGKCLDTGSSKNSIVTCSDPTSSHARTRSFHRDQYSPLNILYSNHLVASSSCATISTSVANNSISDGPNTFTQRTNSSDCGTDTSSAVINDTSSGIQTSTSGSNCQFLISSLQTSTHSITSGIQTSSSGTTTPISSLSHCSSYHLVPLVSSSSNDIYLFNKLSPCSSTVSFVVAHEAEDTSSTNFLKHVQTEDFERLSTSPSTIPQKAARPTKTVTFKLPQKSSRDQLRKCRKNMTAKDTNEKFIYRTGPSMKYKSKRALLRLKRVTDLRSGFIRGKDKTPPETQPNPVFLRLLENPKKSDHTPRYLREMEESQKRNNENPFFLRLKSRQTTKSDTNALYRGISRELSTKPKTNMKLNENKANNVRLSKDLSKKLESNPVLMRLLAPKLQSQDMKQNHNTMDTSQESPVFRRLTAPKKKSSTNNIPSLSLLIRLARVNAHRQKRRTGTSMHNLGLSHLNEEMLKKHAIRSRLYNF